MAFGGTKSLKYNTEKETRSSAPVSAAVVTRPKVVANGIPVAPPPPPLAKGTSTAQGKIAALTSEVRKSSRPLNPWADACTPPVLSPPSPTAVVDRTSGGSELSSQRSPGNSAGLGGISSGSGSAYSSYSSVPTQAGYGAPRDNIPRE